MENTNISAELLLFCDNYVPVSLMNNKNKNKNNEKSFYDKEFPPIHESCTKCTSNKIKEQIKKRK